MLHLSNVNSIAYRWGAAALMFAAGAVLLALGIEHLGGYRPCPLCLQQRWAYYAGVPVLFGALLAFSMHKPRLAGALFAIAALMFLANAGLGVYHAGAEWKFWPGPDTCSGADGLATSAGSLLERLQNTRVVRCDEAALRVAGLSLAGWNVIASLMLCTAGIKAALATRDLEQYL